MDCEPAPDAEESSYDPAMGLNVGQWGYVVLYERARKLPAKRFPFGFTGGTDEQDSD